MKGNKKLEALNDKPKTPQTKRKRLWPVEIIEEIKRIRNKYPNLGAEKIYPQLQAFCLTKNLKCPKPRTIANLIKDLGGLRQYPQKVTHFGKIKKINRKKTLRKPKDFKPLYPGHLVALDTVERFVNGCRRYIITFEDIYTRFSFAWATNSHGSKAAQEFFEKCQKASHFSLQFNHYHTYPKTLKMNTHVERFNRTIQEEFIDHNLFLLLDLQEFNNKLIDYLI